MRTASATVRPDTGFTSGALGMWLFLASEAMLFGALFSGYALLRTGATDWPTPASRLAILPAAINTLVLLASSVTMTLAVRSARAGDRGRARAMLLVTVALAVIFLGIKGSEWAGHLAAGERPATDTFFAIYYTLTGVHALHVLGGVGALLWVVAFARRDQGAHAERIRLVGLYWQFVDLVWVMLFATVYLL